MFSPDAKLDVVLFFLLGSGIFAFVGIKFWLLKKSPFKNFGVAIALFGLAFLGWGLVIATRPENLPLYVALSIGLS